MSARGSSTRLIGSSTSSYGGKSASRPSLDCSPAGHQLRLMPKARTASAVCLADAGDLDAGERAGVEAVLGELLPDRRTALTEVNTIHS
jgi:hypothetical protein